MKIQINGTSTELSIGMISSFSYTAQNSPSSMHKTELYHKLFKAGTAQMKSFKIDAHYFSAPGILRLTEIISSCKATETVMINMGAMATGERCEGGHLKLSKLAEALASCKSLETVELVYQHDYSPDTLLVAKILSTSKSIKSVTLQTVEGTSSKTTGQLQSKSIYIGSPEKVLEQVKDAESLDDFDEIYEDSDFEFVEVPESSVQLAFSLASSYVGSFFQAPPEASPLAGDVLLPGEGLVE